MKKATTMNASNLTRIGTRFRGLGVYFLVVLLPGGLVLAPLLWLQRRFQKAAISNETVPAAARDDGSVPSYCSPLKGDAT
jgi:hypothetical protein